MNCQSTVFLAKRTLISRFTAAGKRLLLGLLALTAITAPQFAQAQAKTYEVLHSFRKSIDGGRATVGLTLGADGLYYGSTFEYGPTGAGTIFSSTADGKLNVLHDMQSATDGRTVSGELLLAADGNFYGTTDADGGIANCGTLFRMSPTGAFTVLHTFGVTSADACEPSGKLVQRPDGSLYGTSFRGGTASGGTLFLASLTGEVTVLHNFAGGVADGLMPRSSPVLMTNGDLYGTSYAGGSKSGGTVWRMDAAGRFSLLHSFKANDLAGFHPSAGLCLGRNGQLYGNTYDGAAYGFGASFRISMKGKVTLLHAWGESEDGNGAAGLIQLGDGDFYGIAGGGKSSKGIVYRMTPSGIVTVLHDFHGLVDGHYPVGLLVQGTDGLLRGTTSRGGDHNSGTIYKVSTH